MDKIPQSKKHINNLISHLENWIELANLFGVDKEKKIAVEELIKKLQK